MNIDVLSADSLHDIAALAVGLWPDSTFNEELTSFTATLSSDEEICFLLREGDVYAGFVHTGLRFDYVEGADTSPVAYIESVYVQEAFRGQGHARRLIAAAEEWAREKGCTQMASDTEMWNEGSIGFHLHNEF